MNVFHGALHPRDILVSHGRHALTGLGIVQALEQVGFVPPVRRPYTAPERLAGGAWDRRADGFSLAALVYEMLFGRRIAAIGSAAADAITPIEGADMDGLRALFTRALAEDPAERFDTALAFAEALNGVVSQPARPKPVRGRRKRESDEESISKKTDRAVRPGLPLDTPPNLPLTLAADTPSGMPRESGGAAGDAASAPADFAVERLAPTVEPLRPVERLAPAERPVPDERSAPAERVADRSRELPLRLGVGDQHGNDTPARIEPLPPARNERFAEDDSSVAASSPDPTDWSEPTPPRADPPRGRRDVRDDRFAADVDTPTHDNAFSDFDLPAPTSDRYAQAEFAASAPGMQSAVDHRENEDVGADTPDEFDRADSAVERTASPLAPQASLAQGTLSSAALEESRSATWPLALALVVGLLVGFAFGLGAGSRDHGESGTRSSLADSSAPASGPVAPAETSDRPKPAGPQQAPPSSAASTPRDVSPNPRHRASGGRERSSSISRAAFATGGATGASSQ